MYSPGITVYISTQSNGILDISEDLISGTMVRRSDGISTFGFMLQNTRRKYDGIFAPNDRIIVMMKRLTWVRVFTGYLNSVPLVTAWPQAVEITSSCSLKRLQYWYWDPGLSASQVLVSNALASARNSDDGGTSNAILTILNNVVGWPPEKVHIAGIPQKWFTWVYKIAKNVAAEAAEADAQAQQFYSILSGAGSVGSQDGGSGSTSGGTVNSGALKPGTYGGQNLDKEQTGNAVIIYNTGSSLGAEQRDVVVALMTAMAESSLRNLKSGPQGHYGLFQQSPTAGWGTVAQITNPQHATTSFLDRLMGIKNRDSMSLQMEAQSVQHSQFSDGSNYAPFAKMGQSIVSTLAKSSSSSSGSNGKASSNLATTNTTNAEKSGKALGSDLLNTALNLVKAHPSIPYQEGGDSPPNSSVPTLLDCSSFFQWAYFHTTGSLGSCPRTSQDQSSWCKSGGSIISADEGMKTQGALMFIGGVGAATHVEISVGDGEHTVGAHHSGTYAGVVKSKGAWTIAGLAPSVDYTGGIGTGGPSQGGGGGGTSQGVQLSTANAQPWYNPNDPFDKLFGSTPWVPVFDIDTAVSEALTGPRALLNDQPLLPYLSNLFKSTMRSFCSAPNGDVIGWFPDYYGLWGTAAIMQVEAIELQDFTVYWDDENFVTHQYTVAPISQQALDLQTATTQNVGPLIAVTTAGIATIDIPAIMFALFGLEPTAAQSQSFINYVYKRFGARPDFEQMPGVIGPQGEFFSALFLFMRSWAYQYNASIPLTFMPELWPGMLIQLPKFGFQAYVTTVTHDFQMGPGGFFNTAVNIAAPARLPGNDGDSSGNLIGLPIAGGLVGQPSMPGTGSG